MVLRLRFITSTPLNVERGSGTFAGIAGLATALRAQGVEVTLTAPRVHLPVYTLERIVFNEMLRFGGGAGGEFDATVGFDLDGYCLARRGAGPHIAALKGVVADELRFEAGMTRATMAVQARFERMHVRRADLVLVTSRHAAEAARAGYSLAQLPRVVPELIDLNAWRSLLARQPTAAQVPGFTVLSVGRFYPRKRLGILLQAAALLRSGIPGLTMRMVGNGPEMGRLRALHQSLGLETTVQFLGDVSREQLAAEYKNCDVFCLPSVQEGFGIVFLEAMGAGKPIVAARAAAVPEVVRHGVLVEPDNAEAVAEGIASLYRSPELRAELTATSSMWVEQFDAPRVADLFLDAVKAVI